jgi:hypothetical protein
MKPVDNLLSMYRREGYTHAPVSLGLCPSLREKYHELAGDRSFAEYFDYPMGFASGQVPGLKVKPRVPVDWRARLHTCTTARSCAVGQPEHLSSLR